MRQPPDNHPQPQRKPPPTGIIVLTYLALICAGIPWYWDAGDTTIWLGFPAWVSVAISISMLTSIFTAWLLRHPWAGEDGAGEDDLDDDRPSDNHTNDHNHP